MDRTNQGRRRALTMLLPLAAGIVVAAWPGRASAMARPPDRGRPGRGGGSGGGGGGGGGTGGGAPLPILGATVLGQAVAVGAGYVLWKRRKNRKP